MAGKFTPSFEGIGEMLRSAEMEAAMRAKVEERGLPYAVAVAPVDEHSPHAGRYKESFVVSSGKDGGYEHDRAYGRLENVSPEALWVEVGSKNNDAHHVLHRAMDVMGS